MKTQSEFVGSGYFMGYRQKKKKQLLTLQRSNGDGINIPKKKKKSELMDGIKLFFLHSYKIYHTHIKKRRKLQIKISKALYKPFVKIIPFGICSY